MELPKISIGLVTYKRTAEALRTVQSTIENLGYPKELRSWFVADDGSPVEHLKAIIGLLSDNEENILGYHNQRMRHEGQEDTHNAGLGWNKCLGLCHQHSDFVLFLEDDWELDEPLDLVPYVRLLQEREDVGICSFRILSVGADVHTVGHDGRIYLKYLRTTQYAFSGNPYLRHARYTKRYGWFAEDRNPGLMELHQDDQYRLAVDSAPEIWRPVSISQWGAFKHIGTDKSWE
jgi:glycosyltransferase involved in cell wall biosynthesis